MKTEKNKMKDVSTILNCIAISHYGRLLSEKISEIWIMDFADEVKQAAIKAISESEKERRLQ